MNTLTLEAKLKALIYRTSTEELNAIYSGLCIGMINTHMKKSKDSCPEKKEIIDDLIKYTFYSLNEYAILDKELFTMIANKLIKFKQNTLSLPKFATSKKTLTFNDVIGVNEELGGIVNDIDNNIGYFQNAIIAYNLYYTLNNTPVEDTSVPVKDDSDE